MTAVSFWLDIAPAITWVLVWGVARSRQGQVSSDA